MSESGDYTSTNWVPSHDFDDARKAYTDSVVNRSYSKATAAKTSATDLVTRNVCIDNPTLIVVSDVTGSMGKWPATMFSKIPYLLHELKNYLGDKAEFLVAAVGDATCDSYPLQVQPPKATFDEVKDAFAKLVVEGGGGGQQYESYELMAGYFLHGVKVATDCAKPILVFIGDESPYSMVNASQLRVFGIDIENMPTEQAFKQLREVYDIYLIHKPYDNSASITATVRSVWAPLLPPEHIIPLAEAERVVDVLFGILGSATGKVEYFENELILRQTPAQVVTVMSSLKKLFDQNAVVRTTSGSGKSTFHKLPAGKPSKPLI